MCDCKICKTIDLLRWATIMECKCICHNSDIPTGHDGLCCAYPNGRKRENPHTDLKPAKEYEKLLYDWENEDLQTNLQK